MNNPQENPEFRSVEYFQKMPESDLENYIQQYRRRVKKITRINLFYDVLMLTKKTRRSKIVLQLIKYPLMLAISQKEINDLEDQDEIATRKSTQIKYKQKITLLREAIKDKKKAEADLNQIKKEEIRIYAQLFNNWSFILYYTIESFLRNKKD